MFILSEVNIDLHVLLQILLLLAGIVALVALSVLLFKVTGLIRSVHQLVEENRPGIGRILAQSEIVVGNVVDITDDVAEVVPTTLEDVTEIVDQVKTVTGATTEVVSEVGGVLANLLGLVRRGTDSFSSVASTVKSAAKAYSVVGDLCHKAGSIKKRRKKSKFF